MREKILDTLLKINEDIITYDGKNMVRDEVLDSIQIFRIVAEMEDNFNINIPAEAIIEENFISLDNIVEMVLNAINRRGNGN